MPGPGDLKKRSSSFSSFKLKMQGKTVSLTATFKVASNKMVDLDGLGKAVEIVGIERPPNLADLLAQHDADGDGKLTLDQFKAILKALMAGGGVEYERPPFAASTPRDSMSEDLVESSLMRIDAQRAAQAEEAAAAPEPAAAPPEPSAAPEPAAESRRRPRRRTTPRRRRWRRAGRRWSTTTGARTSGTSAPTRSRGSGR